MHELLFLDSQLSGMADKQNLIEQSKVSSPKSNASSVQAIIPNFSVISLNTDDSAKQSVSMDRSDSNCMLDVTSDKNANWTYEDNQLVCNLITDDEEDSNASS